MLVLLTRAERADDSSPIGELRQNGDPRDLLSARERDLTQFTEVLIAAEEKDELVFLGRLIRFAEEAINRDAAQSFRFGAAMA